MIASYSKTTMLINKQHIAPIFGWGAAANILKQRMLLIKVLLGPLHLAIYDLSALVNADAKVVAHLQYQTFHHPYMMVDLIRLVQTEFNERFQRVFVSPLMVWWPHFAIIV